MRITVKLEGVGEVIKNLNFYNLVASQKVKEVVAVKSLDIQREAKRACPVDTGTLRNSIGVQFFQGGLTGEIGTAIPYAPYVEYPIRNRDGTLREAQPFLFPSYEKELPDYHRKLREALRL